MVQKLIEMSSRRDTPPPTDIDAPEHPKKHAIHQGLSLKPFDKTDFDELDVQHIVAKIDQMARDYSSLRADVAKLLERGEADRANAARVEATVSEMRSRYSEKLATMESILYNDVGSLKFTVDSTSKEVHELNKRLKPLENFKVKAALLFTIAMAIGQFAIAAVMKWLSLM